jgi:hypothetical protein
MPDKSSTDLYFECILKIQRGLMKSLDKGDAAASWRPRAEAYIKADVWALLQLREFTSSSQLV